MLLGPEALFLPLVGLVLTGGYRFLAAVASALLLLWLNVSWAVPLLGGNPPRGALVWLDAHPGPIAMVAGHVVALILLLIAAGVFSPRAGSPAMQALRAERRGDLLAAGELWVEAGERRRALKALLAARAWTRAAEVARGMGKYRRAAAILQRQGGESLPAAAQLLSRAGDEPAARTLWARYAQHQVQRRRPDQAIDAFLKAGDSRRAAQAAEMALKQRVLAAASAEPAMRAAREAGQPALAAQAAVIGGRFREAGDLFLAAEEPQRAADALLRAGETLRAAEAMRLAGKPAEAARLRAQHLVETGQFEQAVPEFETAGMLAEAAHLLVRLGRFDQAREFFQQVGQMRQAADLARDHGDPAEAAAMYESIDEWAEAARSWQRADRLRQAASCWERAGDLEYALELLGRLGHTAAQAQLLARVGRLEEAVNMLVAAGDMREAWELLSSYGGTFPSLAGTLERLAVWLREQGEVTGAITAIQRATSGLAPSADLLPALYTQAELLEEHGDLRAAEAVYERILEVDYSFRDAAQRLQVVAAQRTAEEGALISGTFPTPASPAAAAESAGRYVLEQELGRGGMGVVYRARDTRLGRTVAIKVLNPRQHTAEAIRRFEREAQAAAALSHPGIVHIYDFDRGFGSFFISMEHVDGPTIGQLLRDDPAAVRANLPTLARQVTEAVAYAHARQVVHRDLKPANLVLAEGRKVKILDFGIARRLDDLEMSASGATGTPYYMAPEQILGEPGDERTDIYSLGITLFQMATGALPFTTGNILRAHLEQLPPDPRAMAPDLDENMTALILQCMAKDPEQRPRDGAQLLALLPPL